MVSAVSFRWFRFVVSGFSTCQLIDGDRKIFRITRWLVENFIRTGCTPSSIWGNNKQNEACSDVVVYR